MVLEVELSYISGVLYQGDEHSYILRSGNHRIMKRLNHFGVSMDFVLNFELVNFFGTCTANNQSNATLFQIIVFFYRF
jgi:hypothetical protein